MADFIGLSGKNKEFDANMQKNLCEKWFLAYNICCNIVSWRKDYANPERKTERVQAGSRFRKGWVSVEKRRIRLEINGVVCGLITEESEEYIRALGDEVGGMMSEIQAASPFITREAAALTVAMSYCDDAKKNGKKAKESAEQAEEFEVELEVLREEMDAARKQAETPPETDHAALEQLSEKLAQLERENAGLREAVESAREAPDTAELAEKLAQLVKENETLRVAGSGKEQPEAAELARKLEELSREETRLKAENEALRRNSRTEPAPDREAVEKLAEENEVLKRRLAALEENRDDGREPAPGDGENGKPRQKRPLKNPLRHDEFEQQGFVSFFEKRGG